tara:strand:+ start:13854 stop:13997 length:144 start_codon:yes stop_codon:yes gene_type:complete
MIDVVFVHVFVVLLVWLLVEAPCLYGFCCVFVKRWYFYKKGVAGFGG